jgi:hypothetical protein
METLSTVELSIVGIAVIALAWFGWGMLTGKSKRKNPFAGRRSSGSGEETSSNGSTDTPTSSN